ncbi:MULTISPECIES: dCMP deaminase [Frankia]|uniref:Riboflavin/cytosine deaminase n=1 Tax=Frankia alni (strain DSM 45986 / CECT 9034 / ACN14a) TaxID=326424 RepID=Q0RF92_FRAAA|nr:MULTISPECIES: dCMP deaminase [Frankia]CAJ63855.1 Putative riboflavin/cytosine deaminase [Frankia alni ACN14a]
MTSAGSPSPGGPPPGPDRDRYWLARAVELGRRCPPSSTAYSVGALIVAADGTPLAEGYSRAEEPHDHAEEVALRRLAARLDASAAGGDPGGGVDSGGGGDPGVGVDPAGATVYSSLEPCSARASRPWTCTELILAAGIGRVVFAWREPSLFVDCDGAERLAAAGVEVVEIPALAADVRAVNSHLPLG